MYYGGQQDSGTAVLDQIYLKTSVDKVNWSAPIRLFSAADVGRRGVHVNDPSVVVNGKQYTMFYTYTESEHVQSETQIYSAVSADGINWVLHKPLLNGGPGEPSAITEMQLDGTIWLVYYVDRKYPNQVRVVKVNGVRDVVGTPKTVFNAPSSPVVISSPEVRFFSGKWQLFFNKFESNGVDLYKITSSSNQLWQEYKYYPGPDPRYPYLGARQVLENPITLIVRASNHTSICGVITPGLFPTGNASQLYDLYFGMSMRHTNGSCPLYPVAHIMRWEMQSL